VRDGLWIGMYPGIVKNGELLSLPGVDPTVSQPYTYFVNAARACGAGFHVMTNAEWAASALLTAKSGAQPRGNTNHLGNRPPRRWRHAWQHFRHRAHAHRHRPAHLAA